MNIPELELCVAKCRENVLRMVSASGHGHLGGAMSCMDIVTALYFYKMDISPDEPLRDSRDRFVLSAGHKSMALYSALAERGYFDKAVLDTYGSFRTALPGHPDMHKLPGVEANTGALGHGLSIAVGMALAVRENAQVYALLGDGELAEGSVWEAAAAAAHYKLSNLTAIVDNNGLQISGRVEDVMNCAPAARFSAFGWSVREIDGNNMTDIVSALDALPFEPGKPSCIIAHTVKGKGVSFAEGGAAYHYWSPKPDEMRMAREESDERIALLAKIAEEARA